MADKTLEQMLEHLVNNEQEKAEELFHEYVVAKSREIYETLIESEVEDEEEVDEATEEDEEAVEEATDESDDEEEVSEELSDDDFLEADDDDMIGGDETDDLAGELDEPMDDEESMDDEGDDEIFQDLEAIIDELQAKFDELKGDEGEDDMEMDGEEPEMDDMMGGEEEEEVEDSFDVELATVREYVEKITGGHGAEKKGAAETADNKKSIVDNMKNDMGGTTANILSGKGEGTDKGTDGGLANNTTQEENAGNINVPGGNAGGAFSTKEPGHGAEKKGSAESADNKQSLFRGKRS